MGFLIRYAIKMVKIRGGEDVARLLREVNTLSRMHHEHIVRYYQASGSMITLITLITLITIVRYYQASGSMITLITLITLITFVRYYQASGSNAL